MQLEKHSLKHSLYLASCSLLSVTAVAEEWDFDTGVLYYGESDRVQAIEGVVAAKKTLNTDHEFKAKLVFDALTGASANGAIAQSEAQTFTRPSGNGSYQANAGEVPLDDTFQDTRVQLSAQWTQPLSENLIVSTGGNISTEYDYQSLSFNGVLARYLNQKNTTLSAGLSYAIDSLDPVGGRPIGLAEMVINQGQFFTDADFRSAFEATRQTGGDEGKDTIDLSLGLTQVINPHWITQFNLGFSTVTGYLTDPYKVLSVIDNQGNAERYLYEHRPDERVKTALYAESKYHYARGVWGISYRFTSDDWGLTSHSIESRYRWALDQNRFLEPHVRFYQQQEADFFTPYLSANEPLPQYASADYRIGKLNTFTLGLKYGQMLANGRTLGLRLEWYAQTPQATGASTTAALEGLDLYPDLDALIFQVDYAF
jgi:hypothetical protein